MSASRHSTSDWFVERLAAGELDTKDAEAVRSRLAAEGSQRLSELAVSNAAILADYEPARVVAEIRRRLAEHRRASRAPHAWRAPAFGLAVSCATLLAVLVSGRRDAAPMRDTPRAVARSAAAPEKVLLKGLRPRLALYRKTESGATRLDTGSVATGGDVLQVAYVAAGQRFGVVASVDALGTVTLHFPEHSGAAPQLVGQGETPLPHAFELDDSPGFERFVFITSDQPFRTDDVLDWLRRGGPPLPSKFSTTEWLVKKVPR